MKAARAGNAAVDGIAIGLNGEKLALEIKSPHDDIVRGVGQCFEALNASYSQAVLVTSLEVGKRLRKRVFQGKLKLIGVDARARIHRFDQDGWRLLG
jgi:hypothetical protein